MAKSEIDRLHELERRLAKFEHPHVGDLIDVLSGHPKGLRRQRVIEFLEHKRGGLDNIANPKRLEETVQASYNRHSADSAVFAANKKPGEKPLFFSPKRKGSGVWAVHEEAAAAWRAEKIPPILEL